jgi:hypothetical protein
MGDGMEVEGKEQANHVEKEVGNVNADSDISFEYGVKKEFTAHKIDTLPFQVQIHYTRLDGSKCVRVLTKQQKVRTHVSCCVSCVVSCAVTLDANLD